MKEIYKYIAHIYNNLSLFQRKEQQGRKQQAPNSRVKVHESEIPKTRSPKSTKIISRVL